VRGLPGGLQACLGESGAGLSGGESRRLALARVVLKSAPVWLLDEPTAGLDEALAERVMANLMRCAGNATVIIAAHHGREAAFADRIVKLDATPNMDGYRSSGRMVGLQPAPVG